MLWALNLDAEDELAGRSLSAAAERAVAAAARQWTTYLAPGDHVLGPGVRARPGEAGRAWCPTPRALRALREAGAHLAPAPSAAVLGQVNERGFAHALGPILEGTRRCTEPAEIEAALEQGPRIVKRGLACAGRGQRVIRAYAPRDRDWITAALREGALYVEPLVEILLEVGFHGFIGQELERGRVTVQEIEHRRWARSRIARPDELGREELDALEDAFTRSAIALERAGYFGPFGIDAFRYRARDGERFHPLGEINARYSMGWPIGMGAPR